MRTLGFFSLITALSTAACLAQPFEVAVDVPEVDDVVAPAEELQLLPFMVRMEKLAHVLQVPVDDPLFEALYAQRFALGDHDYARALRPDRRWSTRKLAIWVRGLLPVCRSTRFAELYPDVADAPDELIVRAYGRLPDDLDHAMIAEVEEPGGTDLDRHAAVCVAVLSSLELVAQ
ncbi:hypothetical protein L6R52_24500 [Myxococcota bacterium]|nr:hypothetical protein [Myxococcota bacterium]